LLLVLAPKVVVIKNIVNVTKMVQNATQLVDASVAKIQKIF
jgi:hypothetical protein